SCCAHLGRTEEVGAAVARSLELDPAMTISRLKAIYPVSVYKNLDCFLDGLRNPNTQTETMLPRSIRITIGMIILAAFFFSLAVIG
ncbi:MAG: hypothetical protein O7A64_08600, partial [Alphaproteobacteria bacterium]|nr:hypothetical protein [Alphaproteobacteria bacterium]